MSNSQEQTRVTMKEYLSGRGLLQWIVLVLGVAMAFFHLYFATIGFITEITFRSGHLMFASILIFLLYPASKTNKLIRSIDWILIAISIIFGLYIIHEYANMAYRAGAPIPIDVIMGVFSVIIVLEITRRTLGWPLVIIGGLAVIYCFVGGYLPGILGHRGFDFDRVFTQMYTTLEGVYGLPLGVIVKYVYFFILFAGFLDATGAGNWFINFSYALTGRARSGPALAAVLSSGFMGSVSGSAVANTVATGSFTIPLMKRVGYKPEVAGAIEAAASTGGQMMPPIMGAGAFIVAEWTGIPYRHIVIVSIIPAILYFAAVASFVYVRAIKMGIEPPDPSKLPRLKEEFLKGLHYLVAILVLAYLIVMGFSPTYSVCLAIGALIVVSFFKKESRLTVPLVIEAMVDAAKKCIPVSAACAAAGIVVGAVGLTGLGLKFSAMVISVAGGFWVTAVLLVMCASIFLGMGLPVTAAYVVLAVLAVPGLSELGMEPLVAHLIVFWYSQLSNLTPPVCLAAYAAAGIAEAKPMQTGFFALALAKGLIIIPFLFVYTPLLLTEGVWPGILTGVTALAGLFSITFFLEGHILKPLSITGRMVTLVAAIACFWPSTIVAIAGLILIVGFFVSQFLSSRSKGTVATL